MCSNYLPVTRADRLLAFFDVERGPEESPIEAWPTGLAPFIRLADPASGNQRIVENGHFGLVPAFAKELAYGRRTYNARSETVARLPSFRDSWRKGWRCIIPAEAIYEPCYESGKAVRWLIQQPGEVPIGIAGIYCPWQQPDGTIAFTFAMLTVNADSHAVMNRMHRPGEEKRMVVILERAHYDEWLGCPVADAPKFFRQWTGELQAFPVPLPPRLPKAKPEPPPSRTEDPGLF